MAQGRLRFVKHRAIEVTAAILYRLGIVRGLREIANGWELGVHGGPRERTPWIRRRRSGTLHILTYHRVNNERDPFFSGTPIDVFARQMKFLADNFTVWPLEMAVERICGGDVCGHAVAVTFDDGYMDNFVYALPVLKRYSIPATIFVATDVVGTDRTLWHDRVFSAFRETTSPLLEQFGPLDQPYPLRSVDEKLHAQAHVLGFLRRQDDQARDAWIGRLTKRLGVEDRTTAPGLMLGWEQAKAMQVDGISFGSHSVTHPILSRITRRRAHEEIFESKRIIENHLGVAVRAFAYPNGRPGDFDEGTKDLLRDAGYACAVTTTPGLNGADQDVYELRRGQPWNEDLPTFALKFNLSRLRPA